ncbi:MAG: ATP synthase F0 subunit B [Nitrospirota bacterium]|nr:ATP synthase F0 subunit B [Nitrospirota bacterium]
MTTKKNITAILITLAGMLVLATGSAPASSGGGGNAEITFWGDWFPRLVNFAIISIVLVYFLRKPTRDFFKNRTIEIQNSIKQSQEAREQAMKALADMERKVRETEAEARSLVADAQARGEKDKQALVEEGKRLAKDIQEQVKVGIELEVQKAKADLAMEAALLSVELAEGTIKKTISKQDHERIVKEYISKVGGRA